MKRYCDDVVDSLMKALDRVDRENSPPGIEGPSTILQFGNGKESNHRLQFIDLPHIKKFRSATTRSELERVTSKECYSGARDILANKHRLDHLQPIIWKLATSRHYHLLEEAVMDDTSWDDKKNMAVFMVYFVFVRAFLRSRRGLVG